MLLVSAASHPCTSENFQVASSLVKKISKSHCMCYNTANTTRCGIRFCVSHTPVCHSLPPLSYCIPGLDAPTFSRCELVAFLLSSSTYCLSPSCSFYFCAENVNQPEKMRWFIYVGVFENNVLCCNLFQCYNDLVVLSQRQASGA